MYHLAAVGFSRHLEEQRLLQFFVRAGKQLLADAAVVRRQAQQFAVIVFHAELFRQRSAHFNAAAAAASAERYYKMFHDETHLS